MKEKDKIDSFRGEYAFLSNFYEAPVRFDDLLYQNNEAAFQAQKCLSVADRKRFCLLNPTEAKKLGRQVILRKDWEDIKFSLMRSIVREKFRQNPALAEKLVQTGDAYLEEGNTWGDRIWGTVNGVGANQLGIILMEVRKELAREQKGLTGGVKLRLRKANEVAPDEDLSR